MTTTTIVRSWPAIGLGAFFASVTGAVLFEDVLHGAPVTTAHAQTLAALVGAIAAGHMAWPAIKNRQTIVQGVMLSVLSVAALFYVCVSSGARNAETAGNKMAAIQVANEVRAREEASLARSEAMLAEAQRDLAQECASGRGKKCRGIMATVDVYTAAIKGHMATLASLPAPKVNGYAHASRVLRSWGINVTDEWLGLNMPFIVVLICELGTISFLHLGLGHKPAPKPVEPEFDDKDLMPLPEKEDNVLSFCKAFKAANGRKPTIEEVQSKYPSTARTTAWRKAAAA
jgi:hypothetical protein